MAADLPLGHWPILDDLCATAERTHLFAEDTYAQAELIYQLGNPRGGYWHLPLAHQTELVSRVIPLIPRVGSAAEPKVVLERLFRLWHGPNPREAIARAVKVESFAARPREPWESIYQVGGLIDQQVDWASESNCPVPYLFWGAVATIAAACRYHYYIDRNVDMLRLGCFYSIFSGKKGTYKSVGMDAAKDVLNHLNCQVYPWIPGGAAPEYAKPNPFKVRYLPEDTNWRTIVGCLQSQTFRFEGLMPAEWIASRDVRAELDTQGNWACDESGTLFLDEAATFFGKENFAVDRVVPGLNALHSGKPYVYQTQSGGRIDLKRPSLTFVGCCPPEIMASAVTPLLFQGGLMDRTIVVHHEPLPGPGRYPTARPRDPVRAAELARCLLPLAQTIYAREIVADRAAHTWYEEWYRHQVEAVDPRETSLARRANHLWRLAAFLCISNGRLPRITLKDFELAAPILSYEWRSFKNGLLVAMEADQTSELFAHIENVLYDMGAYGDSGFIYKGALFHRLRYRKALSPPTVRATPYLESLIAEGRVIHLLGWGPKRGEAYRLSPEAAEEIRARRGPNAPQGSQAPHPPEAPHPAGTASPAPGSDPPA